MYYFIYSKLIQFAYPFHSGRVAMRFRKCIAFLSMVLR